MVMKPNLTNECNLERLYCRVLWEIVWKQLVEEKGAVVPPEALLRSVETHGGFLLVNVSN